MSNARNLANLLGTSTQIKTAKVADDVFQANESLIINGDMAVSQRGVSETGVTTGGYKQAPDRYVVLMSGMGTWTMSQSTDAPSGFSNSYKWECTTADASPAAGDYIIHSQRIEGQNLQHLKKGTADAKSVTVSFWVKSSKTGTYILELYDNDNTRSISKSYTISSANTWEYKKITYAGDTTGTLDNDNNQSIVVGWWLGAGSTYTSGTLATSWESNTQANRAVGVVNLADSTSNDWYITGCKMEIGSVSTPYRHESYGDNLLKCQRYFYRVPVENQLHAHPMWIYTTNAASTRIPLSIVMRAAPTLTLEGSTNSATDWDIYYAASFRTPTNITVTNPTASSFRLNVFTASGLTNGGAAGIYSRSTNAGLTADAEL